MGCRLGQASRAAGDPPSEIIKRMELRLSKGREPHPKRRPHHQEYETALVSSEACAHPLHQVFPGIVR